MKVIKGKRFILSLAVFLLLGLLFGHRFVQIQVLRVVEPFGIDLFAPQRIPIRTVNIRPMEQSTGVDFRWLEGPVAGVKFYCREPGPATLTLNLNNTLDGQVVTIFHNGREVYGRELSKSQWMEPSSDIEVNIVLEKGLNEIAVKPSVWNCNPKCLLHDERPLAFAARKFTIALGVDNE